MKHLLALSPAAPVNWLQKRYYQRACRKALREDRDYPAERFKGRGLVFSVGGERLFIALWVNLCLLRRVLKCALPIEVWHFGENELTPAMQTLLKPFDVKIVDGESFASRLPRGRGRGFALKTLAIIHSNFQEVLFIDADNYAVRDPSFLFDTWPYRWAGACFWPDAWETNPKSAIWSILDLPFMEELEWESGQMVIDKRRTWRALNLLEHLAHHFPFYYQHVYGDKMLFYAAWKKLDQPYAMPKSIPRLTTTPHMHVLVNQFDFQGKLLFQHRTSSDWTLSAEENAKGPKSAHDEESRKFLDELLLKWPKSARNCSPNRKGNRSKPSWGKMIRSLGPGPVEPALSPAPASLPDDKWDLMAYQILKSPGMASPQRMGNGIEALWNSTEAEARAIFRFFAALIFVDPRLAAMVPEDIGVEGTALQKIGDDLQSLITLCAAQEDKTGLLAVHGNLFLAGSLPVLHRDEKKRLEKLFDILADSKAAIWRDWREFWSPLLHEMKNPEAERNEAAKAISSSPSSAKSWQPKAPPGKVLVLTPLKNSADLATAYCECLSHLNYPSELLSLGLLESDSNDDTYNAFDQALSILRAKWNRVDLWKHDFRYVIPPGYSRWEPEVQLQRRKILAQSRNELLRRSLREEDWVLWLDADVIDYPRDIIEQLLSYGKEILHPHCVFDYGGMTFDRNAWRDHGRVHMETLRGQELLAPLDAVGGTMLFIRADLHRRGLVFPAEPYGKGNPRARNSDECYDPENPGELETEGLGIMASDMKVQCWGLPDLEILHRKR